MNQFIIPNEAVKYILFQRTDYLQFTRTLAYRLLKRYFLFSIYNQIVAIEAKINPTRIKALYNEDIRKEYLSIKDFLPKVCSSILDIGCGVSGIDVLISRHYQDKQQTFYLLDKTLIESSVFYEFKQKAAFYNSLEVAKEILVRNGIPESDVHLIMATDNNDINIDRNVDLVVSLLSWGYHYPVETYLDRVYSLLNKDGCMIIDVRKNTNGIDLLNNTFSKVNVIFTGDKFHRVLASK
jgi:hypothetical protein